MLCVTIVRTGIRIIMIYRNIIKNKANEGPSYRVEKNLFSENQKSKLGFDWSECQHAKHGDFEKRKKSVFAKKSWGTFS